MASDKEILDGRICNKHWITERLEGQRSESSSN
jgi:hypothetical protein